MLGIQQSYKIRQTQRNQPKERAGKDRTRNAEEGGCTHRNSQPLVLVRKPMKFDLKMRLRPLFPTFLC